MRTGPVHTLSKSTQSTRDDHDLPADTCYIKKANGVLRHRYGISLKDPCLAFGNKETIQ